ncbi:MAG: NAD(P)/FAD-dependent oxidoreductase [Methyloligellaceae bacterium]
MTESANAARPHVVIVGAGFGGLAAAKSLARAPVDVTIIDKRNYHLFQPLLYQVATADLSPADVAWPIRSIFSSRANVRVLLGKVTGVDVDRRLVRADSLEVGYDHLVIATGSHHSYFGKDAWASQAPGLKRIIDATEIRKRILLAFERAETTEDADEQRRQLNFVIVGGGPTGVEMAGAIAELANWALAKDFNTINPRDARILLVEGTDRLLGAFPEALSSYARRVLEKLGVEILLNTHVVDCSHEGAQVGDTFVPAATIIWGAGVTVPDVGGWLGIETDRAGRVPVRPDLSVEGHPEIFVIGDAAQVPWRNTLTVPGIAPAAKQGGRYVADVIRAEAAGKPRPAPFKYRHFGNLATIGRHAAVIDFGRLRLKGWLAWWIWGVAHIYFLIGVRAPIIVAAQWFWAYLTFKKGARLITGLEPLFEHIEDAPARTEPARGASAGPAAPESADTGVSDRKKAKGTEC